VTPHGSADAVNHFREALRLNPHLVAAQDALAAVLMRVEGMEGEALTHLQIAQQFEWNAERQKMIDRLERSR
jgi:hypothetical protein